MSLLAVCLWSLVRSAAVALLAMLLSAPIVDWLTSAGRSRARILWALVLIPFFVPDLLLGYAYSRFSLSLIHHPDRNEMFYWLLLLVKFVPAAVVMRCAAPPPPLSAEAMHSWRLAERVDTSAIHRFISWAGFWFRGKALQGIAVFSIVFLLVFQEFEIASLIGVTAGDRHSPASWTVWLFDAQAGGLPVSQSARFALLPATIELFVLLPALAIVMRSFGLTSLGGIGVDRRRTSFRASVAASWLLIATLLGGVFPSYVVFRGLIHGWGSLSTSLPFLREVFYGGLMSLLTGLIAFWGVAAFLSRFGKSKCGRWAIAAACLPGLMGSLVLSLFVLSAVQNPTLHRVGDTVAPLIVALILFLIPRVVILQLLLLQDLSARADAHTAALLMASPSSRQRAAGARLLVEDSLWSALFWGLAVTCFWSYWEMTPPAILAPPQFLPFSVLLYNFMHYGQSATLSVMVFAAIAAPILALLLAASFRFVLIRLVHWRAVP